MYFYALKCSIFPYKRIISSCLQSLIYRYKSIYSRFKTLAGGFVLLVVIDDEEAPEEITVQYMSVNVAKENGIFPCNETTDALSPMFLLTADYFENQVIKSLKMNKCKLCLMDFRHHLIFLTP